MLPLLVVPTHNSFANKGEARNRYSSSQGIIDGSVQGLGTQICRLEVNYREDIINTTSAFVLESQRGV